MPSKLTLPKFVDHYPKYNTAGYITTNEEPELFNRMLGKIRVPRAACIASGGEVLISVLLPRADEIVGIDHSYNSIAASYSKLLALQKLSSKQIEQFVVAEENKELVASISSAWEALPEIIRTIDTKRFLTDKYGFQSLRKSWAYLNLRKLAKKAVEKVTLIHGDLKDLKELHGTFDMLYTSNMMEHTNRDFKSATYDDFASLLNPGGLLLYTVSFGDTKGKEAKHFDRIASIQGFRTQWRHIIAKKKE